MVNQCSDIQSYTFVLQEWGSETYRITGLFHFCSVSVLRCIVTSSFFLLLNIGPRWLMPRMYCSHIGLLYYP